MFFEALASITAGVMAGSMLLLAGLGANVLLHQGLDSIAALVLVPFLLKEGHEAVTGECSCDGRVRQE